MQENVNILILDDEPIVGKRLQQALRKNGHHVEIFTSGIEAMKRLVEKKFDIVVTDIRMDEIDGIEVMTRVMKLYPSTKVIIITGYATIETAREALAKGAFDFIAKPFRPNDLRTIIEKAIKAKH